MSLNLRFELSMTLDTKYFEPLFEQKSYDVQELENDEYLDTAYAEEGFLVKYRRSQYKKKVKLLVDPQIILKGDEPNAEKLIRKLKKLVSSYFDSEYQLTDFMVTGLYLSTDLNVGQPYVEDYIKVLQRIGKVKGFAPTEDETLDEDYGFYLRSLNKTIFFYIYDLESAIREQGSAEQRREMLPYSKGKLRVELRLAKLKAIQLYTKSTDPCEQLTELVDKAKQIFASIFSKVIPYGDFYKKGTAVDLLFQSIKDTKLRRKMLRLVALIPEKKSLHLAQKEMNCRTMDEVMMAFAKMNLSPITISKRHDVKHLKNVYTYLDL